MNGIEQPIKAGFERLKCFKEMESEAESCGRKITIKETNKRAWKK
jgi:hypothetical protein